MNQILSETENGQVFLCSKCRLIHFEYKNICFNFTNRQLEYFVDYFLEIKSEFWEVVNANSFFKRKIFIPIGIESFRIILNHIEVIEIKCLLKHATINTDNRNRFNKPYWNN